MNEDKSLSEKTYNFILYLVGNMVIPTKTSLIKMCYLCDLAAVNSGLEQITDFTYIRYYYGPYDKKIDEYLLDMIKNNKLTVKTEYSRGGGEYEEFSLPAKRQNLDEYSSFMSKKEKEIVDSILDSLGSLNAKMLTEIAYKTKPMTNIGATLGGIEHLTENLNLATK